MFTTYKFVCKADPAKNFEMGVDSSLINLNYYIDAMVKSGFEVHGPDVIHTVNGPVAIEPKQLDGWLDEKPCSCCGDVMDLISIEDGYSCRNEECILHTAQEV